MEELEIYDPLEGKPMMIIYMAKSGEKWIKLKCLLVILLFF